MVEAMIFGVFALGYDIIIGKTGMISFGHAAYFGLGIYGGGLLLAYTEAGILPVMLFGIFAATLFAVIVGYFSIRVHGVYFALLTFAFAQILYEIAIRTEFTGGGDGLIVEIPHLLGTVPVTDEFLYYGVLGIAVLVYVGIKRVMDSPLGLIFSIIGENEERAAFLGYNVNRYKHLSFVISGAISGLAGTLFLLNQSFVSPNSLFWFLSGEVIVMTLFGGIGTLYGPMIGAGIIIYLETTLGAVTNAWPLFLGLIFVIVVLLFPQGLVGTVNELNREKIERNVRELRGISDSASEESREEERGEREDV
jgi:branched-chain amino acid transport system permease protein